MTAYQIMRMWDREAGIPPRKNREYDEDVPGGLQSEYIDWKKRLAEDDVGAIIEGRGAWGLSPLW